MILVSVTQSLCFALRMCLVRLKTEGKDGKFMFKKLVQMMWFDVEERIKNLGVGTARSDYLFSSPVILGHARVGLGCSKPL